MLAPNEETSARNCVRVSQDKELVWREKGIPICLSDTYIGDSCVKQKLLWTMIDLEYFYVYGE